jgi:hypothetical protein
MSAQTQEEIISHKSTEELIRILEKAGDPDAPAFYLFWEVVEELEKRG